MGPLEALRWAVRRPADAPRIARLGWHALQPTWSPLRRTSPSDLPIDVLVPVSERHLRVLPIAIASVRRFVRHPIGTIHVVGATGAGGVPGAARDAALAAGATYHEEAEALGELAAIEVRVAGADRSGWIRQQLLKLDADRITGAEHVLVLDADTVFVAPVSFEHGGRRRFFFSGQRWDPYLATAMRLLGPLRRAPHSFVVHHMLMDAAWLAEMRSSIEVRAGRPWRRAIVASLDPDEMSSFSEWETYGTFAYTRYPERVELRYWRNLSRSLDALASLDDLVARYGRRYHTVSFHYRW